MTNILKTRFLTELQDSINRMLRNYIKDDMNGREMCINHIKLSVENFWADTGIHMNIVHDLYQDDPVGQPNHYHISYNDPVKSCIVYKSQGCSHVDGMLCEMETCTIRKDFIEEGIS